MHQRTDDSKTQSQFRGFNSRSYINIRPLLMGMFLLAVACKKETTPVMTTTTPAPTPTVAVATILSKFMPYPVGAGINVRLLRDNPIYRGVVTKEYNSITAENAMKFAALHPSATTYNWTDADEIVSFAQSNGKRVHGHTLNWYSSLPAWVTNFSGDSTAWENMMRSHIHTVVARYKGKVASWDVVNEYFNSDGTVRQTIWVTKLGANYIGRCFQYAHAADPDALLFYNDFGHEYSPLKRNAIQALINSFKAKGIPIHGIGMQFHTSYTQTNDNILSAMLWAQSTGLKVHISELDVKVNMGNAKDFVFDPNLAAQQAEKYMFITEAYKSVSKAQQFGITMWNVGDADSWIPNFQNAPDWPCIFDAGYKRKPAYRGLIAGTN